MVIAVMFLSQHYHQVGVQFIGFKVGIKLASERLQCVATEWQRTIIADNKRSRVTLPSAISATIEDQFISFVAALQSQRNWRSGQINNATRNDIDSVKNVCKTNLSNTNNGGESSVFSAGLGRAFFFSGGTLGDLVCQQPLFPINLSKLYNFPGTLDNNKTANSPHRISEHWTIDNYVNSCHIVNYLRGRSQLAN